MYGKWFASAYTGSMMGAGAHVFAVWGWVVANAGPHGELEINPRLLAAVIGESVERITEALDFLCKPDPDSRSEEHEGRRIIHVNAFTYKVVNHQRYRDMRNAEVRREQNREAKRRQRARQLADNADGHQSQPKQKAEAETEANTEAEAEAERSAAAAARGFHEGEGVGGGVSDNVPPAAARAADLGPPTPDDIDGAVEAGLIDPLAASMFVVLSADGQAKRLGLADMAYAEKLLGVLQGAPYPLDEAAAGQAIREALADLPDGTTAPFARRMVRRYVQQAATRPPGEHQHEREAPKPKRKPQPPPGPDVPPQEPQHIAAAAQSVLAALEKP